MELFRLLGTILIRNDDANDSIDRTTENAERSQGRISAAFSKIGNVAVKCGKAMALGLAAGATAVTALATKSLNSYAEYEQLVGGVETLFGTGGKSIEEYAESVGMTVDQISEEFEMLSDRQSTVFQNADKAYKTAGMSANEYMSTVTSFSASLIQSLGDNAGKAAEVADKAIVDMSDNANKMGTDMSLIQNAYQGFAKQNYTMLDNLKLGYGGTKEEMERLLTDAEKLAGLSKGTFNISSFSDIIEAIHIIQEQMGITGTTAKEASTTIQGSLLSVKAAFKNILTGIADDNQNMDQLVDNLVGSLEAAADNMLPRIEKILGGIGDLVVKVAPIIADKLPELCDNLLPSLLTGTTSLVAGVIAALPQILGLLIEQIPIIIAQLSGSLVENFPILAPFDKMIKEILPQLMELFTQLAPMIGNIVELVVPMAADIMATLLPVLIQIADSLLPPIMKVLTMILPLLQPIIELLQPILGIVVKLIDPILRILDYALIPIIEVLTELINDCLNVLQPIIEWLAEFIGSVLVLEIDGMLATFLPAVEGIKEGWEGIKAMFAAAPAFFEKLWSDIVKAFENVVAWFEGIFSAAVEAIQRAFDSVVAFFSGIWEGIKGAFNAVVEWFEDLFNEVSSKIHMVVDPWVEIFRRIWTMIQEALSPVVEWFANLFSSAKSRVQEIWFTVSAFFENIWNNITSVFSSTADWFGNIFSEAYQGVQAAFTSAVNFFSGIWAGIQNAFGSVASWFKDIFSKAWNEVLNVFSAGGRVFEGIKDGISTVFKNVVNGLIEGINKVISVPFNAINNMLKKIREVSIVGVKPFNWITTFNVPTIPKLERGAVLEKGQTGYLEGNGAEAVVPLEKNKKWIHALADDMRSEFGSIGGSEAILKKLDELIKAIQSLRVYLDSDVLVGELAPAMNTELGTISMANERGQ